MENGFRRTVAPTSVRNGASSWSSACAWLAHNSQSGLDPPRNPARLSPGSHHKGAAAHCVLSVLSNSWLLAHPLPFGYDSPAMLSRAQEARVREILGESPAGDSFGVLPRAPCGQRTGAARPSRRPRGLRPEPPRVRGLPDPARRRLRPIPPPPGSPPCFMTATADETAAPLVSTLVRAGWPGRGPRIALSNGTATGPGSP
jgi:hypothetical protein